MTKKHIAQYILSEAGIRVGILDLGATISFIEVPDRAGRISNVVAGFSDPDEYRNNEYYFGCVVGRYANRIGRGRFMLDGQPVQLSVNNDGNHLHGGIHGLHSKRWTVEELIEGHDATGIVLRCESPAGEEGYPGNLQVRVTYLVNAGGRLTVTYSATTDAATPVNLTNHSYFNLSGFDIPVIGDHLLRVHGYKYTEKNGSNLPSGMMLPVQGTPLDFTKFERIGERIHAFPEDKGYDHNFILEKSDEIRLAAELYDPGSGRQLRVLTDQPGLQVYTANWWDGRYAGPQAVPYIRHGAIALETQAFPDSPNQPAFPDTILRPGKIFQTTTIFDFNTK